MEIIKEERMWKEILEYFFEKEIELHTRPKTKRQYKWFSLYSDSDYIYIQSAKENEPSCKISKFRKLTYKEFVRILSIYYARERGEAVSKRAAKVTHNQVYWYSLLSCFLKNNNLENQ